MERLRQVEVFVAVCEAGGFAAGARRLGLSPPVATRAVAALEARLGARLLHRTTRSLRATEAGERYLAGARAAVAALEEADATAAGEGAEPRGRLVVAAPVMFGRTHAAPLASAYLAAHPGASLDLRLSDRRTDLVEEGVDVALRIGALPDAAGLVARRLGETRRVLVASPTYLAARGVPSRPEELASGGGHETLAFAGLAPGPEWRFDAGPGGTGPERRVRVAPRFSTDSVDAVLGAARDGRGVAPALGYQVAGDLDAGTLRLVLEAHEPPPRPIHAVFPATRLLSGKVRRFVDAVVAASRGWRL